MAGGAPDSEARDNQLVDALSQTLERFERHATGHLLNWIQASGLSLVELQVFMTLADAERMDGGELAKAAGVSVELTYPALHKLAAHGWLEEQNRQHWLSEGGRAKLDELATVRHAAVGDFVASLTPEQRHDLAVAMGLA